MRIALMLLLLFVIFCTSAFAQIDPNTLVWITCGTCPESPEVIASGNTVTVGSVGRQENGSQNNSKHIAATQLPPAVAYTITFKYNLVTWDSYNAPGTPNPPFNAGTGFWDSFSVSISDKPYWQLSLSDPLTTTQIQGLGFLWGGSSYGDLFQETNANQKTITIPANPNGSNYLNVGLDTATFPHSNHAYPSWGIFTILEIKPSVCDRISLNVPVYKQCDSSWGSDNYDHTNSDICSLGCAVSSAAMVLSYHGVSTNPQALNNWLKNRFNDKNKNGKLDTEEHTYGYTRSGLINWMEVAAFSQGTVAYKGSSTTISELDSELCSQRPVILQEPGHFIVATGKTTNSYSINDPGYNRSTLADYNNTFGSMRKFGPPGSGAFLIYANESVHILVTDPLGRRIGYDTGSFVNEIIGASYGDESIDDDNPDDGVNLPILSRVLLIPNPIEGVYKLSITGVTADPGIVDIYRYTDQDIPQRLQTLNTDLSPGQITTQITTYSTRPGDLNSDGFVNNEDLNIVQESLGSSLGTPGYNPVADTNSDGVIDDLDLKSVKDSDGDSIPDAIDNCPSTTNPDQTDSNGNGIGDACEIAPGDLNDDGIINTSDYTIFRSTLGKCSGDASFIADADYDGDGCVTYADYKIWYGYFKNQ